MSEKLIANNTLDVSAVWKIGLHVTLGTIIAGLNIGSYNSTAPSIESVLEMNTFEKD